MLAFVVSPGLVRKGLEEGVRACVFRRLRQLRAGVERPQRTGETLR